VDELLSLLREDATLSMPPFPGWFQGPRQIGRSLREMVLPPDAKGTFRFLATRANGLPAFAGYRREGASGAYQPAALHLLRLEGLRIAEIIAFLDPTLFHPFGLPTSLGS
jgi:RNA polymerase sigma-70 factor (ECF subfamily)